MKRIIVAAVLLAAGRAQASGFYVHDASAEALARRRR
jgi:hypothetical protein